MKAILATLVILSAGLVHAEGGGDSNPWINPAELARQSAGVPVTGPETPEELNARTQRENNPWVNPAELARQSAGVPVSGPGIVRHYPGCYTTYQTIQNAQRNCPPGVIAVRIAGFKGYTCQCNVDTDRGGQ